ncbi:hypothetical protein ILYODFUR_009317 [Ilyodon furcidens]|uniref:Fibronectin type-III domain-containing protein n=1 Tax=Ilyodon furcidens TaxID=33524 RepID=A0ABV0T9X3_9TELE
MRTHLSLAMLCVLSAAGVCSSTSAPGRPSLLGCRSPEKETFSCWWEPGSDGGLPTEYRLFYMRENLRGVHECPDYVSAGKNSCFFDKEHTSIWAEYNLRVVATNALGNASSDFLINDVMKYVKPYPPVNVTVLANSSTPSAYLQIQWKSPPNVDVKSGWVTANYELRIKQNGKEWKNVETGAQNVLNLYSVDPGASYMVQVRCKLDHGNWSEWSNTTFVKIPKHHQIENRFWILVFAFALIPLLATICILVLKRKLLLSLKQWFLPPVPGPMIRGVDVQLFKSGRPEDVVNALIGNQNFPPMLPWTDQVEEYLLVSDSDAWQLTDPYKFHKKKENLIIELHLESKIQHRESTPGQNAWEKAEESKDETGDLESSDVSQSESNLSNMEPAKLLIEEQGCPSTEKAALTNVIQPLANTTYVDFQQRENFWDNSPTQAEYSRVKEVNGETILILNNENILPGSDVQEQEVNGEVNAPDDYSRVKEVKSDLVLLQKHDSADSYCKKKEDHYTEWISQRPTTPHEGEHSKGLCSEMVASGYVDSVPGFSVK